MLVRELLVYVPCPRKLHTRVHKHTNPNTARKVLCIPHDDWSWLSTSLGKRFEPHGASTAYQAAVAAGRRVALYCEA